MAERGGGGAGLREDDEEKLMGHSDKTKDKGGDTGFLILLVVSRMTVTRELSSFHCPASFYNTCNI